MTPTAPRFDALRAAAAAALLAATLVAYIPALQAGFIWDDDRHVERNFSLRSLHGLGRIWLDADATPQYYPLVHTSYWLEYRLWGLAPLGYHAVNVLLHAIGALLVWRALVMLGQAETGAWLAAAIFALHPVHVESVAWITERKNVLSGVCYLAALIAFVRWVELRGASPGRSRWLYAASLALFVCALLSKTVTGSLPVVLWLLLWWKKKPVRRDVVLALVPFVVLAAALGGLTIWLERTHVGATGPEWDLTLVERGLLAGRVFWFYLGRLAWPAHLCFIYPRWSVDATAPGAYAAPVAALVLLLVLWRLRRRIGRGPLTAVLFFAITLAPASGFFNVYPMRYAWVADHFQYLASLGPIALVAGAVPRLLRPLGGGARKLAVAALISGLALLGGSTWWRAQAYHDRETLWRQTLRENPGSWMVHSNLAGALEQRGALDEALQHFQEAQRLLAGWPDATDRAEASSNIGMVLAKQGRLDVAAAQFQEALRLDPGYTRAHNNLGAILQSQGEIDRAIEHFRRALERNPGYAKAHRNLGDALMLRGDVERATAHYREALRFDPDDPIARERLARAAAAGRSGR